jgi:hypothetical protein
VSARLVVIAAAVAAGCLLVGGCTDATGPDTPPEIGAPSFMKVAGADVGGGGGGGVGRSVPGCSSPTASAECFAKWLLLLGSAGAVGGTCGASAVTLVGAAVACGMGGAGVWAQGQDWKNTPDCRTCLLPYPTVGPDPTRPFGDQ